MTGFDPNKDLSLHSMDRRLANQIRRLDLRLAKLGATNRRFSWYRLGVILSGGLATWAAATYLGKCWGWFVFLIAGGVFFLVVAFHRRLDGWIERLNIWREMRAVQLARLNLDWDEIPEPFLGEKWKRNSLDIDLDLTGPRSLHHLLCASVSHEGGQRLAGWLVDALPDLQRIRKRQRLVGELASIARFRERMLLALQLVSKEQLRGVELLAWLAEDYPGGRLRWLLPLSGLLAGVNIALFLVSSAGILPAYWLISLTLYLGLYFFNFSMTTPFLEAVVRLDKELNKFKILIRYLETSPLHNKTALEELCAPFRNPGNPASVLLRRIKLATAAVGLRMNPIMGFFLNVLLPWDFGCAALAGSYRRQAAKVLPGWLDVWYELDAAISLASFAGLHPEYTFPEIDSQARPVFEARALGHPLLTSQRKVRNDFKVDELGQIIVITGSNMAGKSTFIKTVGVNLCLAYAGGVADAASLRCAPFRLHTCIRISDSIADGVSYFYSEVRCLKRLLEELRASPESPLLYLIDEIFRGTNNRERLIGSRAYISALIGKGGVGFLATHDLELASLAEKSSQVNNYHFRDHVRDGKLGFDFKIRPGPSPTTNALKIMEMEGLPVDEAAVQESRDIKLE
jgi:hypothetical protein